MWRRSLLLFLLPLLLSSPLSSAGDQAPEAMADNGILEELSMISKRQLERWETLETELPKLQLRSEALETDLETLSLSLRMAEETLREQTASLESSVEELEREARTAEAWNIALLVLAGIAGGLAIWALAK